MPRSGRASVVACYAARRVAAADVERTAVDAGTRIAECRRRSAADVDPLTFLVGKSYSFRIGK